MPSRENVLVLLPASRIWPVPVLRIENVVFCAAAPARLLAARKNWLVDGVYAAGMFQKLVPAAWLAVSATTPPSLTTPPDPIGSSRYRGAGLPAANPAIRVMVCQDSAAPDPAFVARMLLLTCMSGPPACPFLE